MTREKRAVTIRSKRRGIENRLSINIVKLLGMVMRAFVVIVTRRKRPARMRGDGVEEEEIGFRRSSGRSICKGEREKLDREG